MAYDYCIGIDFGTTNTRASYFVDGDKKFLSTLPSVIFVDEAGEVSVGLAAQNNGAIQPENMICSAKKYIGNLELNKNWNCNGYIYNPTDFAVEVLKEIRRQFIEWNNLEENIEIGAVITVPAIFNDNQRSEIRKAGEIAGFEILWILEDSTAAAVEIFNDKIIDKKILVMDIGGGTFDLSILETDGETYRALAIDGEDNFGGDDFDKIIFMRMIFQIEDEVKINLSDSFTAMIPENEYNKLLNRLSIEARRIKENLSNSERCEITLSDLVKFDGKSYSLHFTISRAEFDEMCRPLYEKIFDKLENFILENNLRLEEIGSLILAGGTCQIPYIRQKISDALGKVPEKLSSDLRLVVSGAARVAEMKNSDSNLEIKSVLPHSLGVAIMTPERKMIFDKLISKGAPYPCEVTREYETAFNNQTRIDINIYEAGSETDSDLKFHRFRGTLSLTNLPSAPKGKTFVDVKFEYTEDQSLRVTAIDKQRANHFERQIIEKPARLEEKFL